MNDSTTITAASLRVDGADLHYELRGSGPLVVLFATPMDAAAFQPLAELLATENTVLTTDPRGINRSSVDDRDAEVTVEQRADDIARLIAHVDRGPATVVGSSGGAVTALALAQSRPELVRTLVAHEPPLDQLLPDRAEVLAGEEDIVATYLGGDPVGAWRKTLALANIELPEELFQQMFGQEPSAQEAADDHYQHARLLLPTVRFEPDIAALRAAPIRIVVGIGEESGGQLCERTSQALAAELGVEPTLFPGDHLGFAEQPEPFATRLRAVLAG